MYKIDLHTHSVASLDGSLTEASYRKMLQSGGLQYIAVTDHNTISFATELRAKLGGAIIVGEEITSREGEIIGLYLTQVVPAGLTARETVTAILQQGGLVYIPHPFETVRKGITAQTLDDIADEVDIVETHNGRAFFQNRGAKAKAWAAGHRVPGAASSDAHGQHGWGRTYSVLSAPPSAKNLPALLAKAQFVTGLPGVRGLLYPKLNRIRRRRRNG